jgi:thermopsin
LGALFLPFRLKSDITGARIINPRIKNTEVRAPPLILKNSQPFLRIKAAAAIALALLLLLLILPTTPGGLGSFGSGGHAKVQKSQPLLPPFTPLPAEESIAIPPGYFIPIEIDTFSNNNSQIAYEARSNISIDFALMNSDQFTEFNSSSSTGDITNSITHQSGTSTREDQRVTAGQYFLVFYDSSDTSGANVTFSYQAYPNTPYNDGPVLPPEPTGIASFGIYNESGNAVPYEINTTRIVGAANISAIRAYNASASKYNDTVSGATLQLNSMLVVYDENRSSTLPPLVYWVQNTPDFVTDVNAISFGDNVWNNTDPTGFLSNSTITSDNGNFVYSIGSSNGATSQYYYGFGTLNYTYSLPLHIALVENVSTELGNGVLLQMGVDLLQNGTTAAALQASPQQEQTLPPPIYWFDNITIHDANAVGASLLVSGNRSTPVGSFYDAELVFGGEGNLEATSFSQLNATLGLYYQNGTGTSAALIPFPTYYSFGGDTGETADNLHVSGLGNQGIVEVSPGTPDYVYLGAVSGSLNKNVSTSAATTTNSTTISPASTSSAVTNSSLLSAMQTTSTSVVSSTQASASSVATSPSSGGGVQSSYSSKSVLFLLVAVAVVFAAIVVTIGSRRGRPPPHHPQ